MGDLLVGAGLVLVFEGLLWAVSPATAKRLLQSVEKTPEDALRTAGMVAVVLGVLVVWLVRG